MVANIDDFSDFQEAILNNEIVYLFGTGISSALTGKRYSWWKWIADGCGGLKDQNLSKGFLEELNADSSADNMVAVVGKVLKAAKADGTYESWMTNAFETNRVTNIQLAQTLKKLLITQDVFATTNYDLILEEATGLKTVSYSEPNVAYEMLDSKVSRNVLHLHGVYDSVNHIDDIIADDEQYKKILADEGAQFIQHILGTRTVIFIGCGSTTDDANIARFIQFSHTKLKLDVKYYFLYRAGEHLSNLPDNIVLIPYGEGYSDLPVFLEQIATERLNHKIANNPIVDKSLYIPNKMDAYGLAEYHFSRETLRFCGRDVELGKLRRFAETDIPFSWWAITGQGGSGKSRLAYHFMHEVGLSYFAFFLNSNVDIKYVEQFIPFNDTFIIVDYVKGNEAVIAKIVKILEQNFRSTSYKLRVLFIERDNTLLSGSWYQELVSCFSQADRSRFLEGEYNSSRVFSSERFLYLEDLEESAVVELIGEICSKQGLPVDKQRDYSLKEDYAQKFEQLKYRPLFLQMYVEAWIDNGCIQSDYHGYDDLLKQLILKEQERMLTIVDNDKPACVSLIKLFIRAGIQGELRIQELSGVYLTEWNQVKKLIKSHSFPGVQRREYTKTLLGELGQELEYSEDVLVPMYPDIIKEYMFLYYIDEDELPAFGEECWINCPSDYASFLSRTLIDFADHDGIREYVRKESLDYKNHYAMEARFAVLQNEVVHLIEEGLKLFKIAQEEYDYWKQMPLSEQSSSHENWIKLRGMALSIVKLLGWSDLTSLDALRELEMLHCVDDDNKIYKIQILLDNAEYFLEKVSLNHARDILDAVSQLIQELPEGREKKVLWYRLTKGMALYAVKKQDTDSVWNIFEEAKAQTNFSEESDVENFAHMCHLIVKTMWEIVPLRNKLIDYAYEMQDLAEKYGSGEKIPFNDNIHYYYLSTKSYLADTISMSATFLGMENYALYTINELIEEIESNEMISGFSGLLVWMWGLKIGYDKMLDNEETKRFLSLTDELLLLYPDNSLLASKAIDLWDNAYTIQFKQQYVPGIYVDRAYAFVLRFVKNVDVIDSFYELLKDSEIVKKPEEWYSRFRRKQVISSLIEHNRRDYLYPPESKEETIRREHRKIGVNEPCPCGSGKKFKKCCKGKGIYD